MIIETKTTRIRADSIHIPLRKYWHGKVKSLFMLYTDEFGYEIKR